MLSPSAFFSFLAMPWAGIIPISASSIFFLLSIDNYRFPRKDGRYLEFLIDWS